MADLVFATRGQAEALKAQEDIAKKSREIRNEFEEGAKSTGKWDAATAKLHRTSETALRSIATEQEKIADKISLIQERQEKGIGTTEENEKAIARLRERWIELDDATIKQRQDAEKVAQAHDQLKIKVEASIDSVATSGERAADQIKKIEEQIIDVQSAAAQGLIPQTQADQTVDRLRGKIDELRDSIDVTERSGGRLEGTFKKLFDPAILVKSMGAFIGIKAAIGQIKDELNDIQDRVDKRMAQFKEPLEKDKDLDREIESSKSEVDRARERAIEAERSRDGLQEQDAKSQIQQEKEIAKMEKELEKAKAERQQTIADEAERQQKAGSRALKNLQRALQDQDEERAERGEISKSTTRRVDDAREAMREYEKSKGKPSTQVESATERVAAIEERIAKAREKYESANEAIVAATTAAAEARQRLAEKEQQLAEATAKATDYRLSDEYKRATQIQRRGKAIDDFTRGARELDTSEVLGTEEVQRWRDALQAIGDPSLVRKMKMINAYLEGSGTVTVDSLRSMVEAELHRVRNPIDVGGMPGVQTEKDKKIEKLLERMALSLERRELKDDDVFYGPN